MDSQKVSACVDAALLLFETIADEVDGHDETSAAVGHIERHMRDLLEIINQPTGECVDVLPPPTLDIYDDVPKR